MCCGCVWSGFGRKEFDGCVYFSSKKEKGVSLSLSPPPVTDHGVSRGKRHDYPRWCRALEVVNGNSANIQQGSTQLAMKTGLVWGDHKTGPWGDHKTQHPASTCRPRKRTEKKKKNDRDASRKTYVAAVLARRRPTQARGPATPRSTGARTPPQRYNRGQRACVPRCQSAAREERRGGTWSHLADLDPAAGGGRPAGLRGRAHLVQRKFPRLGCREDFQQLEHRVAASEKHAEQTHAKPIGPKLGH